jgi:signal recognition particle receptor subunit beta
LWEHYLVGKDGIIFVVDSHDSSRVDDSQSQMGDCDNACDELHAVLSQTTVAGLPLLVLCNKQDIPGALSPDTLKNRLGLQMINDRDVKVMGSCGLTGAGIQDGMAWITRAARRFKSQRARR